MQSGPLHFVIASFQFLKQLELVSLITNQVSLVGDLHIDDLVEHISIFFNQGTGIIAEKGAFA